MFVMIDCALRLRQFLIGGAQLANLTDWCCQHMLLWRITLRIAWRSDRLGRHNVVLRSRPCQAGRVDANQLFLGAAYHPMFGSLTVNITIGVTRDRP